MISYFPVRKPMPKEVETYEKEGRQDLTTVDPKWDPKLDYFA